MSQVAGRMNNYDREWYMSKPLRFTCSAVRKCLDPWSTKELNFDCYYVELAPGLLSLSLQARVCYYLSRTSVSESSFYFIVIRLYTSHR